MESMAAAPGFARAIAGTGPVFAAFLVPHILAGLTAICSGALVMVSRKGTERHVRAGTAYFGAITVLAATGFTSAGAGSASMAMSVLTGIAMLCYAANLYLLSPGHSARVSGLTSIRNQQWRLSCASQQQRRPARRGSLRSAARSGACSRTCWTTGIFTSRCLNGGSRRPWARC
jgi:hypothetical protein